MKILIFINSSWNIINFRANLIKKLIKEVDVIFEGFRPGVMEKLGLSPEECFKLNKSL